jgi:CDP-diacylglycerol pyrophosphatase
MSRKGWKLARAVVVSCVAVAFAFAAAAGRLEISRSALWKVVQTCVANRALTGAAFPCLKVDVSGGDERGYALLRAPWGAPDLILTPTRRIIGVEDPSLQTMETPNYFEEAWNARALLSEGRQEPIARDDIVLAVNPRSWRSQDQLHIHIGCLSRRMRQRLQAIAPELPVDEWARIRGPMKIANAPYGPGLWARRIDSDNLADVNPFRLAAEARSSDAESRSRLMVAVAGVRLADGRGGFVLLAAYDDPADPNDQYAAEDFLDPSCPS